MSGISGDVLLGIFTGAAGFGAAYITNRRSNKTDRATAAINTGKLELDNRREDGEAYERAQQINQQIVEGLRKELTALQATIAELRSDLGAERHHSANLENRIRDLESSARSMRRLLDNAGVTYPPNLVENL